MPPLLSNIKSHPVAAFEDYIEKYDKGQIK
jgi:hypothetical protein